MSRYPLQSRFSAALSAVALLGTLLAGCSTAGTSRPLNPNSAGSGQGAPDVERRFFGMVQTARNLAQTLIVDPFLRPYTTVAAAGSVALKSGAGTLRRTLVNTIEMAQLPGKVPPLATTEPMDLDGWERELDELLGRPASRGRIRFLIGGDQFFPRLTDAIESAEETVHVRTYIFDNDDVAVEIADRLRRRSADVEVRVLLDGLGTVIGTQADADSLPAGFDMPLSMTAYLRNGSKVKVRTQSNPVMTGDHVKSITIDGERAFVGGMNMGREYRYEWHDLMMEVTGPVVHEIQRDADKAWRKAGLFGDFGLLAGSPDSNELDLSDDDYPIRVLYTLPHDSQIYKAQLAAIGRAQSYIYIEQAYFSDDVILYELARARARGVDVRVIVPDAGNHGMMNLSNVAAINVMLANGIRVYHYPGMSHIKAAIFDGWACTGSANFDALSLRFNREMNLATSHPQAIQVLKQELFERDFRASSEITEPLPVDARHSLAELIADAML